MNNIKQAILARNKNAHHDHNAPSENKRSSLSIVKKIQGQSRARKLAVFVIRQLKFNITFVKAFQKRIQARITQLEQAEQHSLEKQYILSLLKQELQKYIGE